MTGEVTVEVNPSPAAVNYRDNHYGLDDWLLRATTPCGRGVLLYEVRMGDESGRAYVFLCPAGEPSYDARTPVYSRTEFDRMTPRRLLLDLQEYNKSWRATNLPPNDQALEAVALIAAAYELTR